MKIEQFKKFFSTTNAFYKLGMNLINLQCRRFYEQFHEKAYDFPVVLRLNVIKLAKEIRNNELSS